jgi:hypothetical protein
MSCIIHGAKARPQTASIEVFRASDVCWPTVCPQDGAGKELTFVATQLRHCGYNPCPPPDWQPAKPAKTGAAESNRRHRLGRPIVQTRLILLNSRFYPKNELC